jgi:23S rRNA (adenine2503-C2)-methyltransferase
MNPIDKIDIKDLTKDQLVEWLKERNIAAYRASQIFKWIYLRQHDTFEKMSDIGKDVRTFLAGHFTIRRLNRLHTETSEDGSRKYLFGLADGNLIESVLIPERGHFTLCISSQVGCAQNCRFCLTARRGFIRNLTSGEIIAQVRDIQTDTSDAQPLTNLVLMGMGEPLANYRHVVDALSVITNSDEGLKFAARRVTLSTAGLVSKLDDLGRDTRANLAVSLNATDNAVRDRLMPINHKYPIEMLLEACRRFPLPSGRRITFEYILMQGINDSEQDAHRLAKLLRPIRAKVNLIPFNEFEGSPFSRPDDSVILRFQEILLKHHYTAVIRQSKGQDISAACGQLSGSWDNGARS